MARVTWDIPRNVRFETTVIEIYWDGIPLGLPTYLSDTLANLMKYRELHWSDIHKSSATAKVYVSLLRRALEDSGFPITITSRNSQGKYRLEYLD